MKELFSIITDLLHSEACVVVPALGGFVVNRKPASVDAASGVFCPPTVQIVFNPKLNHNDGLLSQAWASRHNCTLAEAGAQVAERVEAVKKSLAATGNLSVADFGTFRTVGNSYAFVSAISQNGFSESFGLQKFCLPTLKASQHANPVNLRKSIGWGVAAAALAAVMFFPIGSSVSSSFASLIPISEQGFKAENTLNFMALTARQVEQSGHALVRNTTAATTAKAADGCFYVILEKFDSKTAANNFVAEWQSRLSDKLTVVGVNDNCFAVACASTKSADAADRMQENVRNNSSFKKTFILYK